MNRDELLISLYKRKDLTKMISNLCEGNKYYKEELKQEIFLRLCELPESRLMNLYHKNELNFFIVGTARNMMKSESSKFYFKIKKFHQTRNDHITSDDRDTLQDLPAEDSPLIKLTYLERLDQVIEELDWYDRGILLKWFECGMITKVSRLLDININYISDSLKRSKEFIEQRLTNVMDDMERNKMV